MYKKIVSTAAAMILMASSVRAADNMRFYLTDIRNDKVKISVELSDADKGKYVSLYVLNPQKQEEDIFSDAYSALQYSAQKVYGGSTLNFEFGLSDRPDTEGDIYKYFIMTDSGKRLDGEFEYYTLDEKQKYIDYTVSKMTENDPNGEEIVKTICKMFNLQSFELYNSITDYGYAANILSQNNDITVDTISEDFKKAVLVTAFAKGSDGLLDANGEFLYQEYIEYDEYFSNLVKTVSMEGMAKIINCVAGSQDFKDCEEVKNAIQKEMIAAAIYYNNESGYGYITDILKECKSQLVSDGMNETDFNKVSTDELARKLWLGQKYKYTDLIEQINKLCKSSSGGGVSGGGISSGGSTSSNGGGGVVASPIVKPSESDNTPVKNRVSFSDLNDVEWAREAIEKLYEQGIINGKDAGIFAPKDYITRAEFAAILAKGFDLKQSGDTTRFTDIQKNDWFFGYVAAGEAAGIIKGSGKEFMPDKRITREEMAVFLVRTLMYKNKYFEVQSGLQKYLDGAEISDYAKEAVEVMTAAGIITGDTNGLFRPKDNSTRAEAAVMIMKTMDYAVNMR